MHEPAIERVRQTGRRRNFGRGQVLMTIGAVSDEVLLIESGAVKVVLSAGNGSESIVSLYGPDELIGELGVMSGLPRSATVIGHLPGAAVHVSAATFRRLALSDSGVLLLVNDTLASRLRNADRRQIAMASRPVSIRVASQLLDWARQHGEPTPRGLRVYGITQRELAQTVIASEKTVDDALRLLRADKLVATGRCWYVLLDPPRLEASLEQPDWRPGC